MRKIFLLLFAGTALAGTLVVASVRGGQAGETKQTLPKEKPAMDKSNPAMDRVVADALARIAGGMPAGAPYPILLSVGEGANASTAAENLRRLLGKDARVVFSKVETKAGGPVPDINAPGSHVNTETRTVVPPPRIVLRVSEFDGRVYIAAREPGADPLGPPDRGWLWVLSTQ
jgi:hypothetical protein